MKTASLQIESLELASRTELVLNLYLEAKRELYTHLGVSGLDPEKFDLVQHTRDQVRAVRDAIGKIESMP